MKIKKDQEKMLFNKKREEADTLKELAKELVEKQKTEEKKKAAEKLFEEANKLLESEVKRKNLEEITLAQGMLRKDENKTSTEAMTIAKKFRESRQKFLFI